MNRTSDRLVQLQHTTSRPDGGSSLADEDITDLLSQASEWNLRPGKGVNQLERAFGWGQVTVTWWTPRSISAQGARFAAPWSSQSEE